MSFRQFKTIHARIFLSFSALIVVLILCAFLVFGLTFADSLQNREYQNLQSACGDISQSMDEAFSAIRATGVKIYTSNQFKDLFFKEIVSDADAFITARDMWQTVRTVTGAFSYARIICVRFDGTTYKFDDSFSYDSNGSLLLPPDLQYMEIEDPDAFQEISEPHWIKADAITPRKRVVTVYTRFSRKLSTRKNNVMAISVDYDALFKRAASMDGQGERQVYIFNSKGFLLYPSTELKEEQRAFARRQFEMAREHGMETGVLPQPVGSSGICVYQVSPVSGYFTLTIVPKATVNGPLYTFYFQLAALGCVAVVLAVVLAYLLSKRMAVPLELLKESIHSFDLDSDPPEEDGRLGSGIGEIESLYQEYMRMRRRVRNSLDEVVVAHTHETQSRMLALQAQMNPHFLYNTLAVMSILAEDGKTGEVSEMCATLSGMLRYISGDSSLPVSLAEELRHTKAYVHLMQNRYQEMLEFCCDIPDEMLPVQIPRLTIQPLVENAFKYGINVDPPWHISLTGSCENGRWRVTVRDSGPGIPAEQIASLLRRMHGLDVHSFLPDAKLSGVGLINIYMRLKLCYGADMLFLLENHPQGGACITIGGAIDGSQPKTGPYQGGHRGG